MPIFADRIAELPRLLDALQYHADGLRIDDLATEVGRSPGQVREALLTYYTTDFAQYEPDMIGRPPAIEFLSGPDDEHDREHGEEAGDDDPATAAIVRLVTVDAERELGVDYLPVTELARLYRAGRNGQELDPTNAVLASAVDKLRRGLLPGVTSSGPPLAGERPPAAFARACRERRRIRISYARAWRPGVRDRVIEPYRMIRTRRGWEVDAGPPDAEGNLRTYLLARVPAFEVLAERFSDPDDLDQLLARQRMLTRVELIVPHETRWAVEKYAERADVIEENPRTVRLAVSLLEPVRFRVGLILLDGGVRAKVIDPIGLADAGRELARILLAHYEDSAPSD